MIPDATDRKWYRRTVQAWGCDVVWIGRHKFVPLNGQKVSGPAFGTGLVFIGFDESVIDRVIVSVTPKAD